MTKCIWYISKYVSPPGRSSAGGRGFFLMREFARLGYRSVIITSDSNHLAEVPEFSGGYFVQSVDGIDVLWLRTLKYEVAKSMRRILSWLLFEFHLLRMPKNRLMKPDVIVVSSLSLLTILNGLLLRRRFGCRLIFEIRDIWPLTIVEEGGFSPINPLVLMLGWVERLGYSLADAIVGTMPNLGEHVAKVLGRPRSVACIPMGVDELALTQIEALPVGYLDRYVPEGKFVIVHAGSIGITNALDTFFNCAQILEDHPQLHFIIVGDGDLRAYYQSKFAHLSNLTFAPKVNKQMVQSLLRECDLLYFSVHVSEVWRYGQSLNKVIDYMLAGKPVVASFSGYPSMINEADAGSFVPAGDVRALKNEILRYVDMSEDERILMGKRGREWIITNRDYRVLAKNYLQILFPEH